MSVEVIYTCDVCGQKGHSVSEPSQLCIDALKRALEESQDKISALEYEVDHPNIWKRH